MLLMVSIAVSQVGTTELIFFVDHGVKVNGQYYCDVLLSQALSRCFQQSNVSQNVVSSQNNNVAFGEIGRFLYSVISQGKVVALDR